MKPSPDGWPRISASIFYEEPMRAIEWLCKAFGFEVRLIVESGEGELAHSELIYDDGVVMVGKCGKGIHQTKSPRAVGGNTQQLMVYVDDVEAHCKRAREQGAKIYQELSVTDYGSEYWSDRAYGAEDIEGHRWWFTERIETGNPAWSKVRNKKDRHG